MSLSDFPAPLVPSDPAKLSIVTIGGGHGQARLLEALSQLQCEITALVSVADDGGCSGKLREELGIPPPGDLRRCLSSLATRRDLAQRFEERILGDRSVGNLVIAEMCQDLGSLQLAIDWARTLLRCPGRVVPIAEIPATLHVYDLERGRIAGESRIETASERPLVVNVEGPEDLNPVAIDAVKNADVILIGPGSFFGSTLAALMTADLAEHVIKANAKRMFIENLDQEASAAPLRADQLRVLRDHLVIRGAEPDMALDVLSHSGISGTVVDGLSHQFSRCLCNDGAREHDAVMVARALAELLELPLGRPPIGVPPHPRAELVFDEMLDRAKRRLARSDA
jgi:uncharacterized cofD-like protein